MMPGWLHFFPSFAKIAKEGGKIVGFYFAPMEGITDHIFRNVHHRHFSGADKYFTPFFSPTADGRFPPRDKRDFDPEVNVGLPVVDRKSVV